MDLSGGDVDAMAAASSAGHHDTGGLTAALGRLGTGDGGAGAGGAGGGAGGDSSEKGNSSSSKVDAPYRSSSQAKKDLAGRKPWMNE